MKKILAIALLSMSAAAFAEEPTPAPDPNACQTAGQMAGVGLRGDQAKGIYNVLKVNTETQQTPDGATVEMKNLGMMACAKVTISDDAGTSEEYSCVMAGQLLPPLPTDGQGQGGDGTASALLNIARR